MQKPIFEKYIARKEAYESLIFYNNKINDDQYINKYFPPNEGESVNQYIRRPKIAVPITSSIIDRIVNILNSFLVISVDNQDAQYIFDELSVSLELNEFFRDALVNMLVTGNNLSVLRVEDNRPALENWDGTYVLLDYLDKGIVGYEYTLSDGIMVPVLDDTVKEDEIRTVLIDNMLFDGIPHNLDFTPAVLLRSVDKYNSKIYGKPFPMRFNKLVIEYNHIISQMSKNIKILQNVWKTNLSTDNPEQPIRINPDTINFLGPDGTLEQVARELNLNEEIRLLEILEHHIAKASQVPAEIAGLRDAGKLPSGIALKIVLQPLVELIQRLRPIYYKFLGEISEKLIRLQYRLDNKIPPSKLKVTIKTQEQLFPDDRKNQIDEIVLLRREGLIDDITAKLLIEPVLKVYLTEKGN